LVADDVFKEASLPKFELGTKGFSRARGGGSFEGSYKLGKSFIRRVIAGEPYYCVQVIGHKNPHVERHEWVVVGEASPAVNNEKSEGIWLHPEIRNFAE
jgi:hypothetical protein